MRQLMVKICRVLLTAMGFAAVTGCPKMYGCPEIPAMYGSPHCDVTVKGVVTDERENPIKGIRVKAVQVMPKQAGVELDRYEYDLFKSLTDNAGAFELSGSVTSFGNPEVYVITEDIDGEENGGCFAPETLKVDIVKVKDGDDNWYFGAYENATPVEIKLKPEEKSEK